MKCSKTCGHCTAGTFCSPLNGTCSTGCSSGYFGDLCDKGNYWSHHMPTDFRFCLSKQEYLQMSGLYKINQTVVVIFN